MSKYIISPITTYDEEELLYYTKIGLEEKGMPLYYIACGLSEEISRERAQSLADLLNSFEPVKRNENVHPVFKDILTQF